MTLAGRVALITGAARGLGRESAVRLLAAGAAVAVNVRDGHRGAALAAALGGDVLAVPGDVASAEDVRAMVLAVTDRFGRVDILVNNAAVIHATPLADITIDEWRRTLDVNLTGPFLLTQAVAPGMKARGFGRVINLSSLAGRSVSTLAGAHYTASKAGLLGLTRAAAKELAPYGITVNAVCPGLFDTELAHQLASSERIDAITTLQVPVGRMGRPWEVAELICFLASEAASYVTGASIDINGGSLMR